MHLNPNLTALEIHYDHLAEFASQLGVLIPESKTEIDIASILNTDHPEFSPICYAVIGKAHFLEGDLLTALKYFRKAHTLALISRGGNSSDPNILAYIKYEFGAFWAAVDSTDQAYQDLLEARVYTNNENLRTLIDGEIVYNLLSKNHDTSNKQLDVVIRDLQDTGINQACSFFHLKVGEHYLTKQQYNRAYYHLDRALKAAAKTEYTFLKQRIQQAITSVNLVAGDHDSDSHKNERTNDNAESPFIRTFQSELSARAHLLKQEHELAINKLYEALTVSLEYGIIERRIAQSLYLGRIKSDKMNASSEAQFFYQTAFSLTCDMLKSGFPLSGIRHTALYEYMDFIKHPSLTDQLQRDDDSVFEFAKDRSWIELTDIFKFNLIVYHRQLNRKLRAMLAKIDLTQASFNSKQVLLKKRGFVLPNMKYKKPVYDDPNYSQDLQDYIGRLKEKTWAGARKKFEKEVMQYLYAQNNYNKTHLSKALGFSYSHTLLKMNALEISSYQPGGDSN